MCFFVDLESCSLSLSLSNTAKKKTKNRQHEQTLHPFCPPTCWAGTLCFAIIKGPVLWVLRFVLCCSLSSIGTAILGGFYSHFWFLSLMLGREFNFIACLDLNSSLIPFSFTESLRLLKAFRLKSLSNKKKCRWFLPSQSATISLSIRLNNKLLADVKSLWWLEMIFAWMRRSSVFRLLLLSPRSDQWMPNRPDSASSVPNARGEDWPMLCSHNGHPPLSTTQMGHCSCT